jgi:hypothetical protein
MVSPDCRALFCAVLNHPLPAQLFTHHFTGVLVLIDDVNLNQVLCYINALWRLQSEGALCIPYWAL